MYTVVREVIGSTAAEFGVLVGVPCVNLYVDVYWSNAWDSLPTRQIESCYSGTRVITGDAETRCYAFWELDCCRGFSSSCARYHYCHCSSSIDVASITWTLTSLTLLVSLLLYYYILLHVTSSVSIIIILKIIIKK